MIKLIIILVSVLNLFAKDYTRIVDLELFQIKQQIQKEETYKLALYDYISNEFSHPKLDDLKKLGYLESSYFEIEDISIVDMSKVAQDLYNSDLLRKETHRAPAGRDTSSYKTTDVNISNESSILFSIVNSNKNYFLKKCKNTLTNKYCDKNKHSFRWYDESSNWIEYSKEEFVNGNVSVNKLELNSSNKLIRLVKLNDLKTGAFVFAENEGKYIKLKDNIFKKVK